MARNDVESVVEMTTEKAKTNRYSLQAPKTMKLLKSLISKDPQTSLWSSKDFAEIYERHSSMVRSVAFHISGENFSDDLVQEIFHQVWLKQKEFKGQAGLQTWIYRIAVNTSIDHYRKEKSLQRTSDSWKNEANSTGRSTIESAENTLSESEEALAQKNAIDAALLDLSVEHRTIIVLFYLEEKSISEIAEALEIAVGTVKSRLHHSRIALKNSLERRGIKL